MVKGYLKHLRVLEGESVGTFTASQVADWARDQGQVVEANELGPAFTKLIQEGELILHIKAQGKMTKFGPPRQPAP